MGDLFGIGWRPALAAGILGNLDAIDLVEVIADDCFDAPSPQLRALETLGRQLPLVLHGVSLGLASAVPVELGRLERTARLVERLQPRFWSEHLAFVRGGGLEVGHLAAPPRTDATVEGTAKNLARARQVVGSLPLVENIATLIDPPASTYTEPDWIGRVVRASGCSLLLDLHNLYANCVNFGCDPVAFIAELPPQAIQAIHLAGGRWIAASNGARRLLDDHRHAVPEPVYELLTEVGRRFPRPLTVVLERDGAYPPFAELLEELARARRALGEGRARAGTPIGRRVA